jgi:hypothetical protein
MNPTEIQVCNPRARLTQQSWRLLFSVWMDIEAYTPVHVYARVSLGIKNEEVKKKENREIT